MGHRRATRQLCGTNKHRECGGVGGGGWVVADFWPPNGNGNTTGRLNAAEDQPKFVSVTRAAAGKKKYIGNPLSQLAV